MKKNCNEPHRHHYISQFIIKNFGMCKMGIYTVNYYDKKRKKFLTMPTEDIFVYNDLYRDEINNFDNPVKIEKDFAKYEGEIAKIFKNKILNAKDRIVLTKEENDSLLLFLALMQYRSKHVFDLCEKAPKDELNAFMKEFNMSGDAVTLWRKNLGKIVNCRSLQEVLDNPEIDELFKALALRDTFGLLGRYLIFVERRGNEDFFLSDSYPLEHNVVNEEGESLPLMTCFPISPSRMVLSVCNGAELAKQSTRIFDKSFFAKPYLSHDETKLDFCIRKMYEKDIADLNDCLFKYATEGVAVFDINRFFVKDR